MANRPQEKEISTNSSALARKPSIGSRPGRRQIILSRESQPRKIESNLDKAENSYERLSIELWEWFRIRLETQPQYLLKQLCQQLKIRYSDERRDESLLNVFQFCLKYVREGQTDKNRSPWETVLTQVINRLLFLLKFNPMKIAKEKNPFNADTVKGSQGLKPIGLQKSVSHPVTGSQWSMNNLQQFRAWMESYQKWKSITKVTEDDEDMKTTNIQWNRAIMQLFEPSLDLQSIQNYIEIMQKECVRRITGVNLINRLTDAVQETFLEAYLCGVFCTYFKTGMNTAVSYINTNAKQVWIQQLKEYLLTAISIYHRRFTTFTNISFETLLAAVEDMKKKGLDPAIHQSILDALKFLYLCMADIAVILSSMKFFHMDNDLNLAFFDLSESHEQQVLAFISDLIQTSLLSYSFVYVSGQFEDASNLAWLLISSVSDLCLKLTDSLPQNLLLQMIRIISRLLNIEMGISHKSSSHIPEERIAEKHELHHTQLNSPRSLTLLPDTDVQEEPLQSHQSSEQSIECSVRLLLRLWDICGINRISHLLEHVFDIITTRVSLLQTQENSAYFDQLVETLFFVQDMAKAPVLTRLSLRILTLVLKAFPCLFTTQRIIYGKFYLTTCSNAEQMRQQLAQNAGLTAFTIASRTKPDIILSYIDFDNQKSSSFCENNFTAILQEIGALILNEESPLKRAISYEQQTESRKAQKRGCKLSKSQNSSSPKEMKYVVLAHLSEEEDVSFLVKVLYYWEERYPTFTLRYPQTLAQQSTTKEVKEKRETNTQIAESDSAKAAQENAAKAFDKLFTCLPEISPKRDDDIMPIGWPFNYTGIYQDFFISNPERRQKVRRQVKKVWSHTLLNKLEKKYDELIKMIDEYKAGETEADKLQILLAKNFIKRMQHHVKEAKQSAQLFNVFGYSPVGDYLTEQKALELAYLLQCGIQNKLKPINLDFLREDLRKIVNPSNPNMLHPGSNAATADKQSSVGRTTSLKLPQIDNNSFDKPHQHNISISLCDSTVFAAYDVGIDSLALLQPTKENFIRNANRLGIIHCATGSGSGSTLQIQSKIDFIRSVLSLNDYRIKLRELVDISFQKIIGLKVLDDISSFDFSIMLGIFSVLSGWLTAIVPGTRVTRQTQSQLHEDVCTLIHGGEASGQNLAALASISDWTVQINMIPISELSVSQKYQITMDEYVDLLPLAQSICCLDTILATTGDHYLKIKQTLIILRCLLQIAAKLSWSDAIVEQKLSEYQIQATLQTLNRLSNIGVSNLGQHAIDAKLLQALETEINRAQMELNYIKTVKQLQPDAYYDCVLDAKDNEEHQMNPITMKTDEQVLQQNNLNYNLPLSTFLNELPEQKATVDDQKMLKHWEKFIIPKLQDFVRTELKPWEFEDFFEQIRQPLRKGDQTKAAEVAYIICGQRLPSGVTLPEANHDWTTISIEDIKIGQMVAAKLQSRNGQIYLRHFLPFKRRSQQVILVQVVAIEVRSSSILVLYLDIEQAQYISCWLPVTCLKTLNVPMISFSEIGKQNDPQNDLIRSLQQSVSWLSRQFLIQSILKDLPALTLADVDDDQIFENLVSKCQTKLIDLICWSVNEEFAENPLPRNLCAEQMCYIDYSPNTKESTKLNEDSLLDSVYQGSKPYTRCRQLAQYLRMLIEHEDQAQPTLDSIVQWLEQKLETIRDYHHDNGHYTIDLYERWKSNPTAFNLNCFQKVASDRGLGQTIAIDLHFKKTSHLCWAASAGFFSEIQCLNRLEMIQADKEQKSDLKSLLFVQGDVFFQYGFNADILPAYLQDQDKSDLSCIVFAIPQDWMACFWLLETISYICAQTWTQKSFNILHRLTQMFWNLWCSLHYASHWKESVTKLMLKILRRYDELAANLHKDIKKIVIAMEIAQIRESIQTLVTIITEQQEKGCLISPYCQSMAELISYVLSRSQMAAVEQPNNEQAIPGWLLDLRKLWYLSPYISIGQQMPEDIALEFSEQTTLSKALTQIIVIENIFIADSEQEFLLQELIQDCLQKNQARFFNVRDDLLIYQNKETTLWQVVILVGWWDDESLYTIQVDDNDEAEQENAAPPLSTNWICEMCTLENNDANDLCEACESPRPLESPPTQPTTQSKVVKTLKQHIHDARTRMNSKSSTLITDLTQLMETQNWNVIPEYSIRRQDLDAFITCAQDSPLRYFLVQRLQEKDGQLRQNIKSIMEFIQDQYRKGDRSALVNKYLGRQGAEVKAALKTWSMDIDANILIIWQLMFAYGFDFWTQQSGQGIGANPVLLSLQQMKMLLKFVEEYICQGKRNAVLIEVDNPKFVLAALQCSSNSIVLSNSMNMEDAEFIQTQYGALFQHGLHRIRHTWAILREFNILLHQCLPMIDMSAAINEGFSRTSNLLLSNQISNLRHLLIASIKTDYVQDVLKRTAIVRKNTPKVHLNRMKLARHNTDITTETLDSLQSEIQSPQQKSKDNFALVKVYEQLCDVSRSLLRPPKPAGTDPFLAFEVIFKGELVMGESGPYRQLFADMSAELQPSELSINRRRMNLFCPSVNNYSRMGEGRDKFVINPSACAQNQLDLFEFLGCLMGTSMRTGTHFTLDLPSIFWKRLVDEEITLADLEEIDKPLIDLLHFVKNCDKQIFSQSIFETFTTFLSDRTQVELMKGGRNVPLTYENRYDYIEKVFKVKLTESEQQLQLIKKGLNTIIPRSLLQCVTGSELESWICGRKEVDFELLRRHTVYSGDLTADSRIVHDLWDVLTEFNEADKLRFVKFCWGQERLPANDDEFLRSQTRFMVKSANYITQTPDKVLPRADTCFFNIELPNYSTREILKQKLLTAIHYDCESINADEQISLDPNAQQAAEGIPQITSYDESNESETSFEENV